MSMSTRGYNTEMSIVSFCANEKPCCVEKTPRKK
jgi:hypothetical protein